MRTHFCRSTCLPHAQTARQWGSAHPSDGRNWRSSNLHMRGKTVMYTCLALRGPAASSCAAAAAAAARAPPPPHAPGVVASRHSDAQLHHGPQAVGIAEARDLRSHYAGDVQPPSRCELQNASHVLVKAPLVPVDNGTPAQRSWHLEMQQHGGCTHVIELCVGTLPSVRAWHTRGAGVHPPQPLHKRV
jgi:hypothetical protein